MKKKSLKSYRKRLITKRVCKICNNKFETHHPRKKTCGEECSKIYTKELKRLYRKNNPEKVKESSRISYHKYKKFKKKICKICGKIFYLRGNKGKTCSEKCSKENIRRNRNRNSRIWVIRHPERKKKLQREYSLKNTEKLRIKSKKWRKKNPEKVDKIVRRWQKNNKHKIKTQKLARYYIKIPKRQLCQICNTNLAVERHHSDYNKPLDVQLLCKKCHSKLRGKNEKE